MDTKPAPDMPDDAATTATLNRCGMPISAAATAEEIARAVDEQPRDEDWYLILGLPDEDEDVMVAALEEGGTFSVQYEEGEDSLLRTVSVVDAELLKQILVSFLQGDGHWRSMARWGAPIPTSAKRTLDAIRLPPWGLIAAGLVVAAFVAMGEGRWAGALFLLAIPVALAAVIVSKLREVRRAAAWTKASAHVLRSELVTRKHHGKQESLPVVEYEFSVGFDKFRGQRVSVGEIMPGSARVEGALKRYPAGASVPVFYDPKDPRQSVLERELPANFGAIWAFVAVVAVACVAGVVMLLR